MIWIVIAILVALASLVLILPFFRKTDLQDTESAQGLNVYKQQLNELDADIGRGVITETEAEPVRLEIQRRILRADHAKNPVFVKPVRQQLVAGGIVLAVIASSLSLYSYLGSPDIPSKPLASRDIEQEKHDFAGQDLQTLVKRLAEKLQDQPDNLDGWVLLARTLSRMKRYEDAARTYLQATKLAPKDADLYVAAAENYFYLADGVVSDAALMNFKKAYTLDPLHPGARYYMAIYDLQDGRASDALDKWIALYQDSDATEPYMSLLSERIRELGDQTGRDVAQILETKKPQSNAPGPSREDMEAAAEMSAADRQDMINQMVARLDERMQNEPDFEGLMRLGKAYSTQQNFLKSSNAYARAAALEPANAEPLTLQALALVQDANSKIPPVEAIEIFKRVLALDETVTEAHWYLGVSDAIAGRNDTAIAHWQKILTLVSEDHPIYANVTQAINTLSQKVEN